MSRAATARLAPALWALALAGCAATGRPVAELVEAPVELADTPFFPQERYQCGPAALATALAASGVDVTVAGLVEQVYLPGRRGSLQAELIAATRRQGRLPYVLAPEQMALAEEIQAGRPVVVLQNLGVGPFPRWHYAVVVGMDPVGDAYVLRSGTERRRVTDRSLFLRTWERGENWAMVTLSPGELPVADDPAGYLRAVAAAEATGYPELARAGFDAALARWPGSRLARLGLANVALAGGDLGEAERQYRRLLASGPDDVVVMNNLAETLARAGRTDEARRLIARALEAAGPAHPLAVVLEATRSGLAAGGAPAAQD